MTCRRSRSGRLPRAAQSPRWKPHTIRIVDQATDTGREGEPGLGQSRALGAPHRRPAPAPAQSSHAVTRPASVSSSDTSPSPSVSKSRRAWKVGISAWSTTTSRRIAVGLDADPRVVVDREVAERVGRGQRGEQEHAEDAEQDGQTASMRRRASRRTAGRSVSGEVGRSSVASQVMGISSAMLPGSTCADPRAGVWDTRQPPARMNEASGRCVGYTRPVTRPGTPARGWFITIEGPEGAGKTTQAAALAGISRAWVSTSTSRASPAAPGSASGFVRSSSPGRTRPRRPTR